MAKIERREGTSTEGRGLGHSFAADNVERGDPDVDFIKRRPTYPIGDDPRGREIDFEDTTGREAYGSTRNPVFRAYHGAAPLEGQEFGMPARVGSLDTISDLRPELPTRSVDTVALDAAKEVERQALSDSEFGRLFPQVTITSPGPGATFSPGTQIEIRAIVTDLRSITQAVLFVDNTPADRRVVDRRDQEVAREKEFIFFYDIPADRILGGMDITVRGFNISSAAQGIIADDAKNAPPLSDGTQGALGTLDGRIGQLYGTEKTAPLLDETGFLRTPEGVASITVNIV